VTCCTGPLILIIGSTVFWLLSLVVAVEESLKAASLKEKSIIYDYLMFVIIDTVVWATVIFNVCWPCWPPFAFVMLGWFFIVELMYDP
jgi:hypothetical protein